MLAATGCRAVVNQAAAVVAHLQSAQTAAAALPVRVGQAPHQVSPARRSPDAAVEVAVPTTALVGQVAPAVAVQARETTPTERLDRPILAAAAAQVGISPILPVPALLAVPASSS